MNPYLNDILYAGAILVLIFYLAGRYKERFSRKYFSLFSGLLLVYVVGALIAFFRGINLGYSRELVYSDLLRSLVFPLSLALAGLMSRIRNIKNTETFVILLMTFFIVVIISNILFRFVIPGSLIKITTVQLFSASAIGFLGLYLLANRHHQIIARFIILVSWLIALLSLAKWNLFPIIILPILWIIIEAKRITARQRLAFCLIIIVILIAGLFVFQKNIMHLAGGEYQGWNSFWRQRLVVGDLLAGGHIRTGGRLLIWSDLLRQFSGSPLLGIGFGARPTFANVEDHNMFIFFLVRFGLPLFCLGVIISTMLIVEMLRYQRTDKMSRLILFFLIFYFFFCATVGTCFGEMLNGLTIGLIIGFILNPYNNRFVIKEKNNESAQ